MGQLRFKLVTRGGARPGAGRPRIRQHPGLVGPGVPHLQRADFPARHPVHVTLRLQPGIGYLRSGARARLVQEALRAARDRFGMRIAHYSIQGSHLHLIVEAAGAASLSQGMQGFCIRLAKRLNALARRQGGVFADRYHAHVLASRRQVANAVHYVLRNYRHHAREPLPARWEDALSSARYLRSLPDDAVVAEPKTWLLRVGWKLDRAGPPL